MSLLDQVETKSKSFDGTVPPVRVNVQGVDGIGKSTLVLMHPVLSLSRPKMD